MIVCTEKSLAILLLICIDIDSESFMSTAVKIDVEYEKLKTIVRKTI